MAHKGIEIALATEVDTASIFAEHAASRPEVRAILAPGRSPLNFARLYEQQLYVCEALARCGIDRGDPVALLLPKGPEMAAACAVLPASATVVPLDPNLSTEEYETIFRRCSARALITPTNFDHKSRLAADRIGMFQLELSADLASPAGTFELHTVTEPKERPGRTQCDANVAYIHTTSGTTAERKLVPIQHRNIVAYAKAMEIWLRFEPTDLSLHLSPMYFGHGINSALMVPLLSGTSVVCPPAFEIDAFFQLVDEYQPTWFGAGFTVCREILNWVERYKAIVDKTRLRFIRSSSGQLTSDEITRMEEAFGSPLIVPLSSTETCLITCNPLPPQPRKLNTVGPPVVNEVMILGDDGRFLDAGQEGEIVVRGPMVFEGYIDDPVLNSQAFFEGWYRTGDLGFLDADNYLTLVGRKNEIINRGGEKISPVEVDSVLISHPDISDAAAFAISHPTLGEIVGAAVVGVPDARLNHSMVIRYLEERLNPIKVPREVIFVEKIPRGASGKIQRAELSRQLAAVSPPPRVADGYPASTIGSSATPTEIMVSVLWQKILKKNTFGLDDDFFRLGGDSLTATQLVLSVNEGFRVEIQVETVFSKAKTIRTMAAKIEELRGKVASSSNVDVPLSLIDSRITAQVKRATDSGVETKKSQTNSENIESIFILDKKTGFRRMRPLTKLGSVVTNSHGFRSPEISVRKPSGTIRLSFHGNSVTFGSWDRGNEDTWPYHVMETLRRSNREFSWDYVNSAHPGMGIKHATLQIQESISKFQPDIMVIMPGDKSRTASLARKKIKYSGVPYTTSQFGQWSQFTELIEKNLVISMRMMRAFSNRGKLNIEPSELKELAEEYKSQLQMLVSECQNNGSIAVLVISVSRMRRGQGKLQQIRIAGPKLYYQPYMTISGILDVIEEFSRVIREVAIQSGAILVDLNGVLPATKKYYEDTSHFTATGHGVVGEHIGRALSESTQIQHLLRQSPLGVNNGHPAP